MAHVYDLSQNVTIEGGKFKTDVESVPVGTATLKKGQDAAVIEDKHGILYADKKEDSVYTFQALTGGEFQFKDNADKAYITSFDGSAVSSGIEIVVNLSQKGSAEKLSKVYTGSGKDSVEVGGITAGEIDLGAGNDIIGIQEGTATVTLGSGRDTITFGEVGGTAAVKITDYNYAEGDVIWLGRTQNSINMNYAQSIAIFKGDTQGMQATVTVASTMNNGVYEFQTMNNQGMNPTHYVRTNVSSVDYVAKDAIDFESDKTTTTLNLTLAGKAGEANSVVVNSDNGTANIVAGKAETYISIGTNVELGLGISKKSGNIDMIDLQQNPRALLSQDTLYLVDGGAISQLKFVGGGNLQYGDAVIQNGFNSTAEGTFKYNTNGKAGVLAYGKDTNSTVTYAKDITYYANAKTVNAEDYGEAVLNLNGDSGENFADSITEITGVTSGLIAGRNNVGNSIKLATEANKKTEVYGGVGGADTIDLKDADSESTNVIWYSNGDGKDTVSGFQKGNNSIYFHDATAAASVLNDALTVDASGKMILTLAKGKDELTLDNTFSKTIDFKDAAGNKFKVAVGDGKTVDYAAGVNIYKGATTLKVSGSDDLILYTGANNDQYGYFNGITKIDAAEAKGTVALSGSNVNGMEIQGGTGVNNMWGGGDKVQTLTGGDGVNVFWFGNGDGRDTAKNAKAEDGINLYNVEKIDDVAVKASTNYFTVTVGSNALKVDVGNADATTVLEKFTFADKAGVLYTYNTKTNKFQQK